ncbi:MAG: pyruvate dehydrogenase (acetyl-transferring), homodimeric type [Candidatus Sumerlaeia bacterium]
MGHHKPDKSPEKDFRMDDTELREWFESLDDVIERHGDDTVRYLIDYLRDHAYERGIILPFSARTPFINTIPPEQQARFVGSRETERRIKSIIRWNAMAMVVRANKESDGIGGHISTYASAATLYEVAFNHFLRARTEESSGDQVYFQGHSSPGVYARAFLEGRLSEEQLVNFRRELQPEGGLSSYPHPWLMPDFWQFPTVSMGLGPINAIYQARFNTYIEHREIRDVSDSKVWAFLGDGETDEPETLGAIKFAAQEELDNLVFVINCNLQRLDGPVRGNGKVIQDLEATFRGAGWKVIKVLWGTEWDELFEEDDDGLLLQRVNEMVDGESQKLSVAEGDYVREHFFGKYPELKERVKHLNDEHLKRLRRGGHDPYKVFAAFHEAMQHEGSPTVILAQTIKGYGLGEAGEGRNVTHSQKKLNEEELREFRTRFGIPISDEDVDKAPFYKPPEDSAEMQYLQARREELGGYLPKRVVEVEPLKAPDEKLFEEYYKGSGEHLASTTMVYVRMLSKLLKDKDIGKLIVPIVPDEARTFGMDSLFRQVGIYSHVGQIYEPVDSDNLLYYKEAIDGQILEEGITEAGSMASFIAAGTAYATHGVNTIPFFSFYSMFGFQRVGDQIWAAADMRVKGFLVGGTAGRTTLNGEGLQHADGHSHLLAYAPPNLMAYDPAFAYEIAVIVREGIRRMFEEQEDIFYYFTAYNENYIQEPMPGDVKDGILKGLYCFKQSEREDAKHQVHLLGSGPILRQAIEAREMIEEACDDVAADVWSVTSYKQLRMDALECERWNMLHPDEEPRVPYVTEMLSERPGVFVAASDYLKALPDSIARWIPGRLTSLGTEGFGRSESRAELRNFFEIDKRFISLAALWNLAQEGDFDAKDVKKMMEEWKIDPEKVNPMFS